MLFSERQMETDKQFFALLDGGFSRAKEQFIEWNAAYTCSTGNFRLAIHCQQGNRTICSRKGMGNIASQRSHVTNLRTCDQVAGFDQGLGHVPA